MVSQALVMVPSKDKSAVFVTASGRPSTKKGIDKCLEFIEEQPDGSMLLGVMGGPAQNLFVRAFQLGLGVARIPWFTLQELTEVPTGATALERAAALMATWEAKPDAFYALGPLDSDTLMLRELTRVRLAIQETYRKPAQLQYQAAFRDLEPLLGDDQNTAGRFAAVRTVFADSAMIEGAKRDEKSLEAEIKRLAVTLPIWGWLHPSDGSVLPVVKGLGPSLGGSLVAEIGDIRRFPGSSNLRSYARFHVNGEGGFPRRQAGQVSAWNRYLNRAVWLWSTDQMPRYDHVWRRLYDWKKSKELLAHPEPLARVVATKRGGTSTVYNYTLKHLDVRAKRWTGSQLLNYVFDIWNAGEETGNPEVWYAGSRWLEYFAKIESDLDEGLAAYLAEQIPLRRRREPVASGDPDEAGA